MTPFRSILFCSLSSHDQTPALRRVVPVVEAAGADLTILGAVPAPSTWQRLRSHGGFVDEAQEALYRVEHQRLSRLAAALPEGIRGPAQATGGTEGPVIAVDAGNAAMAVLERVERDGHDLVVLAAAGDHRDGAVVRRLLRKSPAPVWVIRPTRARTERVIAAVNASPDEEELNLDILGLARWMHETRGGELHVVHAWELFGEDTLRRSPYLQLADEKLDALTQEELDHQRQALDELLAKAPAAGAPWQIHLDKGRPADVVVEAVRRQRATLLVLGTVARSGLSGLVMGNTAETILDQVPCSVLALKPRSFHSPVVVGDRRQP